MNRNIVRFLIGAAVVGSLAADAANASAQTTFTACRVPTVGVIYLLANAADPCLDAAHVKFQWTDGGAPAANSVTSAMIVDGTVAAVDHAAASVNSAAIVDGTIATVDVANGAITQAKLDGGVSFPPGANSVTSATILDGSVATADIADGAVTLAKVTGMPGVEFTGISATGISVTTQTNVATISVTAPSAGFVVLRFDGMLWPQATDQVVVAASNTSATWGVNDGNVTLYGSNGQPQAFSHSRVYSVSAGLNTFYAVVHRYSGSGTGVVSVYGMLAATFFPVRY